MKINQLIKYTCVLILLGRSVQHIFFDSPIRGLLYSPIIMEWPLSLFNIPFDTYINSPFLDERLNLSLLIIGLCFLISSIAFIFIDKFSKKIKISLVYFTVFLMTLVSFAYFKDKSFSIGQFFEYSSQMFLPLYFIIKEKRRRKLLLQLLIAITFICHGLYAIGYYPVPGNFMQMIISTFNCSNQSALLILKIAGLLDFIFAIGIFIPKIDKPFLIYGLIWGGLTTIARLYTNMYSDFLLSTFSYWLFEFLVRIPHFIIPLVILKFNTKYRVNLPKLLLKY